MKIPKFLTRKKTLRASVARRSMNAPDEMDYEEMSEPNMKLSRALLIVLVLHVVAMAGIIAFNTIKGHQSALPQTSTGPSTTKPAVAAAIPRKTEGAPATQTTTQREEAKPALPVTKEDRAAEPARALPVSASSDARVYVVVKGDNPVSIARRLKVSESDLLTVNHIDDPRKLQIGQKLIIPAAKKTKK